MESNYFNQNSITLNEAIAKFKLPKSYVLKLIKKKYINVPDLTKYGVDIQIDFENQKKLKFLSENPEYHKKVLDFNPSFYYDYCMELIEYHPFHDFIDRYCWLIKLYYTDKKDIKNKKFRLDTIFQNFLLKNKFSIEKFSKKIKKEKGNSNKIIFHLKKGWYNELSRSLPLNKKFLEIGTKINGSVADATSTSWNITQTYYSIYEYTNSMAFLDNLTINTKQHRTPTNIFNNGTLRKFKKNIFFYPFFISSHDNKPTEYPKHLRYEYTAYPRDRTKRLPEVNKDVVKELKKLSKNNKEKPISLVDFLYEFRVWANYTGVDTIIKIKNGSLIEFLYKNLGTLNFFIGGLAELSAIAKLGEDKYMEIFNDFVNDYILQQPQFVNDLFLLPIFVRHRIYKHLKIISTDLPFLTPMYNDPLLMVNLNKIPVKKNNFDSSALLLRLKKMSIKEISQLIIDDWKKQGKVPKTYLKPMLELKTLDDSYGSDSATSIISYFISNCSNWHGDVARTTKKYLKEILSEYKK
jgi:hypothetical protein